MAREALNPHALFADAREIVGQWQHVPTLFVTACQPFDSIGRDISGLHPLAGDFKRESKWHDACFCIA
jgi:hypothetical protein